MSELINRKIRVKRRVWAELKAEATVQDKNVSRLAGELLGKIVEEEGEQGD